MNALVSVLIPVYNRVSLVSETIESARNQTYQNIEIIIVDNCSTDGTWDLLKDYAIKDNRIRIFQNLENIGPVRNWKRCIDEAKGEYAKILFSDDLIAENFIKETIKLFDENTAFVLTPIKVFGNGKNYTFTNYKNRAEFPLMDYLFNVLFLNKYRFPVSPGAAIFRTNELSESLEIEIENSLGLNFQLLGAGNDLLLFLNSILRYKKIKISQNSLSYFRSHDGSFTINNKISVFYEYAKYHFIKTKLNSFLAKLKFVLWLRKKMNFTNDKVYNLIDVRKDNFFFIELFIFKFFK